jgi:hypothetical protein
MAWELTARAAAIGFEPGNVILENAFEMSNRFRLIPKHAD